MLIVASDAHRVHHPHEPFLDAGRLIDPPEVPERADRILGAIAGAGFGAPQPPDVFGAAPITRVHPPAYLHFLEHAHRRWRETTGREKSSEAVAYARAIRGQPEVELRSIIAQLGWYSHDTDPILAGTYAAAIGAVDVTLTACEAVADGRAPVAYALARPPGHHAAADSFAGYCYLNNAAIAAQAWTDRGARVAIIDVDYHHGNGTQQIFYERDDVLFVSLHADPAFEYPFFAGFAGETGRGAGAGYTRNFPLPAGTDWGVYAPALAAALHQVRAFGPDAVIVSLGVDTAAEDADTFQLIADDYPRLGSEISKLDRPTLVVQEGGYCLDVIGRNVVGVLRELG